MTVKPKFLIITTIPLSLGFFRGQIQVLKSTFKIELVSSAGILLDSICRDEAVKGHVIEMRREISFFNDLKSLVKLIKLFLRLKPSVIHGSTPKAGLLSMIAGWLAKVPNRIYYVHGLRYQGSKGFKNKILKNMERLSCLFATQVFVVSKGVKQTLIADKITKKQIAIIGNGSVNGIDVEYFSSNNSAVPDFKQAYNLEPDNFIFGFVGRLVKDKGINELVQAFLKVNTNYPKTKLLVVGDFDTGINPIDSKVKDEIYANINILNVGFQQDIRPFLKMMHVFVFPSYREGFGVSLMEAAAMGVPAISSDIIGCNEIIINELNGLLIPPKSTSDLVNAMIRFIEDTDFLNKTASMSRKHVIQLYEQQKLWQETLEAYKELVFK